MAPFDRRAFITGFGLTAVPLVIAPILISWLVINPELDGLSFGITSIVAFLLITFLMVVYSVVAGIIRAIVLRKNHSSALGVLIGLAVGLLLGVGSCAASFAVIS